ncbi:hypothetical protein HAALTHF_42610n [Vreelandella aquamarina]|nr:hypothetical protein HAALTHF_42610n [Halomonas axialensis]
MKTSPRLYSLPSSGIRAGTYREGEHLLPIVARPPAAERDDVALLENRNVWSAAQQRFVPISQVVSSFDTDSEEALIQRRNRVRTLTVGADPAEGYTAAQAFGGIREEIEAMTLPPGYQLSWGGEHEDSGDAQEALAQQLPISLLVMLLTSILLFGKLKQPLIIWLVVPMSVCGVVIGLLVTGLPFSFTALLGMLSLSGMLMKNAIVLVDEIDGQIKEGKARFSALVDASISRLRPVFLAAGTTILGMLPLLADAFFNSMAVTIMGGLAFALAADADCRAHPVCDAVPYQQRRGRLLSRRVRPMSAFGYHGLDAGIIRLILSGNKTTT